MPALYTVQVRTHTGSVREVNEDAVSTALDWRDRLGLSDAELRLRGHLFAVADGMGGHAAGEIASQLALETLFTFYYTEAWHDVQTNLSQAIRAANDALCQEAEADRAHAGMGTTLVTAVLHDSEVLIANIGDSRAYLFHAEALLQITRDHSWVVEQVEAGLLAPEDAARHPLRNVITRSLGPDRDPTPDLFRVPVDPGDVLFLCSDGLSNLIPPEELAEYLGAYSPDEAANFLLQRALERGASDNVTMALIELRKTDGRAVKRWLPWAAGAFFILLAILFILWRTGLGGRINESVSTSPTVTPTLPAVTSLVVIPPPRGNPLRMATIVLSPSADGEPTPDAQERFGPSSSGLEGAPLRERYVYYLQGPLSALEQNAEGWEGTLQHETLDGKPLRYRFLLRGGWLNRASPPAPGANIGLIARPINEDDTEDPVTLEPLLLMEREPGRTVGRALWVNGELLEMWLENHDPLWVFTVYGNGGSEGLNIATPPGLQGQPIVVWGVWQQPNRMSDWVDFTLLDAEPYELDGGRYRQPDN